ncbi:MAG: tRNA lysidine(34) synthetase TilS [Dehalococcoidales bacterium]
MPTGKIPSPEQKVLTFINEKKLVSRRDKLVVAVSGGPDSVCLLYVLAGLRKELDIDLHIAHLNHQLRGENSAADAKYVTGLAKKLGIPATIASRDVKAYRKQRRLSLEEAARLVRYSFLADVAATVGATKVAVGHTADDHAETMLMHLLRGSGIKGLRGLAPLSKLNVSGGSLTVIRPLLDLNREETVDYCRTHNLKPRLDASNLSTEPVRNKIRLQLLPLLRKYNPQITQALLRLSHTTADDLDFIEVEARRFKESILKIERNSVIIKKKDLLALHPALQRQILRFSIESLLGSLKDIEAGHIEDIIDALEKPAGKVIGLPFGINFTIEYERYVLAPESLSLCPFPTLEGETALKIPGKTLISGWAINTVIEKKSAGKAWEDETGDFSACFDFNSVGKNLTVRHRLTGDRFQPLGMKQPKKLNVFMIDARIPQTWRRRIPLVCSDKEIIWVVGYRINERNKVRPDTKEILRLDFKKV